MKTIKIGENIIDTSLVIKKKIARDTGFSQPYISQLLNPENKRKNKAALNIILKAIKNHSANMVKCTGECQDV